MIVSVCVAIFVVSLMGLVGFYVVRKRSSESPNRQQQPDAPVRRGAHNLRQQAPTPIPRDIPSRVEDLPSDIDYKDQSLNIEDIRRGVRNTSLNTNTNAISSDLGYNEQAMTVQALRSGGRAIPTATVLTHDSDAPVVQAIPLETVQENAMPRVSKGPGDDSAQRNANVGNIANQIFHLT